MKNFKQSILIAFLAIGAFVISSCTGDESVTPSPVLNFLAGAGYTSDDATVAAGSDFKVGLSATHDSKIEKLEITVSYDGAPATRPLNCTMCDTTINESSFTIDFENTVANKAGSETWDFTITDKDGNSTSKSLTLTRTTAPKPVRKISVTLGNQNSASVGSSYSLDDFTVYTLANAKASSAKIDLIYVVDGLDGSMLVAPSDQTAADKFDGKASSPSTWATRNVTKIRKTTITSNQYNGMTDSKELLAEAVKSDATGQKEINLASGNVYYIEALSGTGRSVLVLINSIDVDETMTISVLAEE